MGTSAAENEKLIGEELKYSWDKNRTKSVLVARRMMYDHPKKVLQDYKRDYLKEVFLKHYNLFNSVNRNFWKIILGISNEEIERKTERSFREACKIWNY